MNADIHTALQEAAKSVKRYAEYTEWALENILDQLTTQPFEQWLAAHDDVQSWVGEHVKAACNQLVFQQIFENIKKADELEHLTRTTQPDDFDALGEHWTRFYEQVFTLLSGRGARDRQDTFEQQLLMRQPSRTRQAAIQGILRALQTAQHADNDRYAQYRHELEYNHKNTLGKLIESELPLPDDLELAVLEWAGSFSDMQIGNQTFFPALVKIIEARLERGAEIPAEVIAMLRRTDIASPSYIDSGLAPLLKRVGGRHINHGEPWADAALRDLEHLDQAAVWLEILSHAFSNSSKPSAAWEKTATKLLETIGVDIFATHVLSWLEQVGAARTQPLQSPPFARGDVNLLFDPYNTRVARGLTWFAALLPPTDNAARIMANLTLTSLKKVAGVGPRDPMLANAGVFALGRMNSLFAVGQLARLKTRVTFKTTLKEIEKALENAATRQGMTKADLEELSVPSCGLESVGAADYAFGDVRAELRVQNSDVVLTWFDAKGKVLKNPPTSIKKDFADDLKDLKTNLKDLEQMLSAQSVRLERFVLSRKSWNYAAWTERYRDHPLVGCVTKRLIWTFTFSGDVQNGIWHDGAIVDSSGQALEINPSATVSLWHPMDSSTERVLDWRRFLETRGIVQPWKQAHREIYILTAAEEHTDVYSNRFAAHVLKQHQFAQLAALRGWNNKLRLMVDDSYPPATLELPQWGLRAEFWVEGAGDDYGTDTTEAGTYLYLTTDQVRFYPTGSSVNYAHAGGGGYEQYVHQDANPALPLRLETIPALVLSEVLRDVDLFVGVTSVGNDPAWNDGGPQGRYREYWQSYSFGELSENAQSRAALLETLIPRLKIKDVTSIQGKFLHVKGSLHEYKIHMGSGNILMLPNDQYLCIVPGQGAANSSSDVQLPFEGDRTLAVILSKAFMLADDKNIKDVTITQQIKG